MAEIDQLYQCIARRDAEAAQKMAILHINNAEKAALEMLVTGTNERV